MDENKEAPLPCPMCKSPAMFRALGKSYWFMDCSQQHINPVASHPMRTKKAALQEWNKKHGNPPENQNPERG